MLIILVFGASGDLARRKTYPALFALYQHRLLHVPFRIIGYARSAFAEGNLFHERIRPNLQKGLVTHSDHEQLEEFLKRCDYISGNYDSPEDFIKLKEHIAALPVTSKIPSTGHVAGSNSFATSMRASDASQSESFSNVQIFYLALPPSVFTTVCQNVKHYLYDPTKSNRIIIEKPFGRDLQSSSELSSSMGVLFDEREIYRIDHYLGKEMVKNIMILRFANLFFNAIWSRQHIASVQIVFKEMIGVEGRGGYFDEYGIIRDVMQNHLLQILSIIAMERPASLDAEDVRDEKVKVLRCIREPRMEHVILGQYGPSMDGSKPGYADDETVPMASNTPTYALVVLYIDNERWAGVPFFLRSGKALNEQKAEIRIQFADVPGLLFDSACRNELVIRVQPNESVYMKMLVKRPGFDGGPIQSDLDLSYASRYVDLRIPDAYESLILDALRGDHSNFVRTDELMHAWKIFTPLLHRIDTHHIPPTIYPYGSRGPPEADQLLHQLGYVRSDREYSWPRQHL